MKVIVTGFVNTMTKPQRIAGWIYLPLHIVALPILLGMLFYYVPIAGITENNMELWSNITYFAMGFAFCLIAFWRYLRSAFDILLDNLMKNILMIVLAYLIYTMLSYVFSAILLLALGDELLNPNNEEIISVSAGNYRSMLALTVFVAPVVEECLFRGVVFGSIRTKNRTWAYIVSIVLFSVYHIWQYAFIETDATVFIYALQYIPAAYALTWCYERTNCLWMSIFLHMLINGAAMAVLV